MITTELKSAIAEYVKKMTQNVTITLNTGQHPKKQELQNFLKGVASATDRIIYEETGDHSTDNPLRFGIGQQDGDSSTRIFFSGIPGGHEFNSFILAILQVGGASLKIDDAMRELIGRVDQSLQFEVFVSLSCHNCPDVVQILNQFAVVNDNITVEMIDGGLYPERIAEKNIQGVPSVFLNGKPFANGKIDPGQILDKLISLMPHLKEAHKAASLPTQDVTVIGGGPAGVAAAIYAARKGLAVTIVADRFGGQVKDTLGIENLISVPKTTGPELVCNLLQHMTDYDITLKEHLRVERIIPGQPKVIELSSGEVIHSHTVILATGAKWRELGVPGERENIGKGVAYCPHCDGPFFKGQDVAVIGGGNSGVEAALDLAGVAKSVTVFEFMPSLKADSVLVQQAERRDNIHIKTNMAVKEVLAEGGHVTALIYEDRDTKTVYHHPISGIFVQIGLLPNSQFLGDVVERTQYGEIVINEKCETSHPGIFACGDVTTVPYKQIVIAMGEGAKASLAAFEYCRDITSEESEGQ